MLKTILTVVVLLLSFNAQTKPLQYLSENMTVYSRSLKALPNNTYDMAQDHRGYYWFATSRGLFRFDGNETLKLYSDPGQALHDKIIGRIMVDGDTLWVGSVSGLSRINLNDYKFEEFSKRDWREGGLYDHQVRAFHKTENQQLWVATSKGISQYQPRSNKFATYTLPPAVFDDPNKIIESLSSTDNGLLWLTVRNYGLLIFDRKLQKFINRESMLTHIPEPSRSLILSEGLMWASQIKAGRIGLLHQEFYIELESLKLARQLKLRSDNTKQKSFKLFHDRNGKAWITSRNSDLISISKNRNTITHYHNNESRQNGLNPAYLNNLYFDKQNQLGISYLNNNPQFWNPINAGINHIPLIDNGKTIKNYQAHFTLQTKTRAIWLVSEYGHIIYFSDGFGQQRHIRLNTNIWGATEAEDGGILVNSNDGIFKIDAKGKKYRQLNDHRLTHLISSKEHGLWGTSSYDIRHYSPSGKIINSYTLPGKHELINTQILLHPEYGPWTLEQGIIYHLNRAKTKFIPTKDLQTPRRLFNAYRLQDFSSWHADNGLYRIQLSKKGDHIYRQSSKVTSGIHTNLSAVISQNDSFKWISDGRHVLYRYNTRKQKIQVSTQSIGFPRQVGSKIAGFDNNNHLILTERDRLIVIAEIESAFHLQANKLIISSLKIHSNNGGIKQLYAPPQDLQLQPGDVTLNIGFTRNDYLPPGIRSVRYRLKGVHDNWLETNRSDLSFSGLNPGDYVFELKEWGTNSVNRLSFVVHPPWWRTNWAYTFYFLAFSFVIGTITNLRWQKLNIKRMADQQLQLYAQGFENVGEGFCIIDKQANILSYNRAFTSIAKLKNPETQPVLTGFRSDKVSVKQYLQIWTDLGREGFWEGNFWIKNSEGIDVPVECKASRVQGQNTGNFMLVLKDITERIAYEEELKRLATFDSLTGLPNRALLNKSLLQIIASAKRHKENRFCILFLDLDRFKIINDTLGHEVGDLLLIEIANRLKKALREEDVIARLGGDEFVIIINNLRRIEDVQICCENVIRQFRSPITISGNELFTGLSIGIATYPEDGTRAETLLKNADAAMYNSKNNGGNSYSFYTNAMNDQLLKSLKLEAEVRKAIENDELEAYFQPKIDLQNQQIIGFEALVRWFHQGEFFPADELINIAERTGLIAEVGMKVLDKACELSQAIRRNVKHTIPIAVNVSAKQLAQANFVDQVNNVLNRHMLTPNAINLEITETILMDDHGSSVKKLEHLQQRGHHISVDDFGTGYSSLAYLSRLPIDELKIDRSFVINMLVDNNQHSIVKTIIDLAKNLNLNIVAEGIECLETHEQLRLMGCPVGQGYLYARPMSADNVLDQVIHNHGVPLKLGA